MHLHAGCNLLGLQVSLAMNPSQLWDYIPSKGTRWWGRRIKDMINQSPLTCKTQYRSRTEYHPQLKRSRQCLWIQYISGRLRLPHRKFWPKHAQFNSKQRVSKSPPCGPASTAPADLQLIENTSAIKVKVGGRLLGLPFFLQPLHMSSRCPVIIEKYFHVC